jgi:hypothetical protein
MASENIITFLETLGSSTSNIQRRADVEIIASTLRLWENCRTCTTREQLSQALGSPREPQQKTILVIDRIDHEILSLIQSCTEPKPEVLLLTDHENPPQVPTETFMKEINHFISASQGRLTTTALITAVKKISSREIFGIDKYLAYGTPLQFFVLLRSEDRSWFVERFMKYVSGLEGIIPYGSQEFARMTGEVLDELLMNAIWDANPRRNSISRNTPVQLDNSEGVHVEWGVDGNTLAVGVRDPFGTFKRDILVNYQDEIFGVRKANQVSVNTAGAGAGIGLHMVLRRSSGLVINSTDEFATEVIALFDLSRTSRSAQKGSKTLHFFLG